MNDLYHYASPYYDPVKAHEYYEEHKKLKGRRSTAGLTEEGRNIAKNVKDNLTAERKSKEAAEKEKYQKEKEDLKNSQKSEVARKRELLKADIQAHASKVQFEAAKLRILLDSGALKNDADKRQQTIAKIKSLYEETNSKREELINQFQADAEEIVRLTKGKQEKAAENYKNNISGIRSEYDSKYESELESIRSEYTAQKKAKSSKSSKSSSKKSKEVEKTPTRSSTRTSTPIVPVKKEQTSKWAKNRAKRKEKAARLAKLGHSALTADEIIEHSLNTQLTMSEIIETNKKSDNRIGNLDEIAHSLLDTY